MHAMASPTSQRWFASIINVLVGPISSRMSADAADVVVRVGADLDFEVRPAFGDGLAAHSAHLFVGISHPSAEVV